jgi:hypothetical protein
MPPYFNLFIIPLKSTSPWIIKMELSFKVNEYEISKVVFQKEFNYSNVNRTNHNSKWERIYIPLK